MPRTRTTSTSSINSENMRVYDNDEVDTLCDLLLSQEPEDPVLTIKVEPMVNACTKMITEASSAHNCATKKPKMNKTCSVVDCSRRVRSRGLCKFHGGGKRCKVQGCYKCSQSNGLCIKHGGGKRCIEAGCDKSAQSNGRCKKHGGGLRCSFPNCTKSSQGGGYCFKHGGGRRCRHENCTRGAQRDGLCSAHGGSRTCKFPGCKKNDRGGGRCAEHGGGKRCSVENCNGPARRKGLCSLHARQQVQSVTKSEAVDKTPKSLETGWNASLCITNDGFDLFALSPPVQPTTEFIHAHERPSILSPEAPVDCFDSSVFKPTLQDYHQSSPTSIEALYLPFDPYPSLYASQACSFDASVHPTMN